VSPLVRIFAALFCMILFFGVIIADQKGSLEPAVSSAHAADKTSVIALRGVKKQLPNTEIQAINCNQPMGLCEIRAGQNIYYTDKASKYLIIGHVYDLVKKVNLTEASLRNEVPSAATSDGVAVERVGSRPAAANLVSASGQGDRKQRVNVASFPSSGAIVWGKASGMPVYVFSDFRCGYCRALSHELKKMNVKVYEFPISILGSREISEAVFCAKNKVLALHDAYAGVSVVSPRCDTNGLDLNEDFARKNDFVETPIIVRADGDVLRGLKPREELLKWLNGGKS
jgi:thiol:disulfide interchange protein DsbC